jgi:hypothetical protein
MKKLVFTEKDFLDLFDLPQVTYEEFLKKVCVLDVMDRSGSFVVRSNLNDFVDRVSKKDDRKNRLELYKRKLYQILVCDAKATLQAWFASYGKLHESIEWYLNLPRNEILVNDVFAGNVNSKYGKICKNINFENFYNTKKLYANDSEYTFGLMKVMFEEFKLRNSLIGPAFFDHVCSYEGNPKQFWLDFMIGANRASIFNPVTYHGILNSLFEGKVLFAPVMGWNAYQIAFYNSNFEKFISTDVIPSVVENGHLLQAEYDRINENSFFVDVSKTVDLYLCPSEKLEENYNFVAKYKNTVDAVLFSPPYFDLELYPSENQSIDSFPDYSEWLKSYWEETVKLCIEVMKPGARFGFVISNYKNRQGNQMTISQDMRDVVAKYLTLDHSYRVRWSAISGSRQAKKTRDGNYEDLWLFVKK